MKFDIWKWRITITPKKELPVKDTCWYCCGHRFKYKKGHNGTQKLICLDCGKIGYKYLGR